LPQTKIVDVGQRNLIFRKKPSLLKALFTAEGKFQKLNRLLMSCWLRIKEEYIKKIENFLKKELKNKANIIKEMI